jgi:N-acetylneuraminic acid mutarotase
MKKKPSSPSAFFNPRALIILVLCSAAACSLVNGTSLAILRRQTPEKVSQRTLTFDERVSYQRAIEEVYWRHRIWPKERPDRKPSLDALVSQAQIEKKVSDYLRNSQALEDYWQRPITAEQLQAEMDRMATHTRQPEVLRELFEALGNDPFVIGECLARPALAERLVTNWYAYDQRFHGGLRQRAEADLQAHCSVEQMKQMGGKYNEVEFAESEDGERKEHGHHDHVVRLGSHEWNETIQKLAATFVSHSVRPAVAHHQISAGTPTHSITPRTKYQALPLRQVSRLQEDETRYYGVAVLNNIDHHLKLATVSWLKEPFESWRIRSEIQVAAAIAAPNGNYLLPAIIEGSECVNDTWTATPGPPDARDGHTAVWTGSEMIIWGGPGLVNVLNTGGRYNPATDSWTPTNLTNAPDGRFAHTAVWTGNEMIVWGGYFWDDVFGEIDLNTGGRYNPVMDTWIPTSVVNAPSPRSRLTAVWSGSEMIIWGNAGDSSGGRYNPDSDSWTATSIVNAPMDRYGYTVVWSGNEMIIWGGYSSEVGDYLNTGGRYNPSTNSWTATGINNAPSARSGHTAVWTGAEMIVWGGASDVDTFNTGARYNPVSDTWASISTTNVPTARSGHTAVWTGSDMIIWCGFDNVIGYTNTGGRYNPGTDVWTATNTSNAPDGRTGHTAVWSGDEMIVWGGYFWDGIDHDFNTGGRYDPITDSWTPTGPANAPMARYRHIGIWTGAEMIVWGGRTRNFPFLNTGGKYDTITDNWTPTTTSNAPSARVYHTAVWTGSDMIVWGGLDDSFTYSNTGARYNPGTDGWIATSTANAPAGRWFHTAVWTGNRMVVWGGSYDDGSNTLYLNTGGMYNPSTDAWVPTSTTNVPIGRDEHIAVWTGDETIVWGGYFYDGNDHYLNTGGRFDPDTNTWATTSTTNAPSARSVPKAVWTGSEMITWGGYGDVGYMNTGGRFSPNTNNWTSTATVNAPSPRAGHGVVWTGTEMIVWGGVFFDGDSHFLNDGGKYDPTSNNWTDVSIIDAPSPRDLHAVVWTGNEMIVWGGLHFDSVGSGTGGRYCVQSGPTPTPSPTPTPCTGRCGPTPRPRPTPHVRPTR